MKRLKSIIALILSLSLLLGVCSQSSLSLLTDTDDITQVNPAELDGMIADLTQKIAQCNSAGLSTDYEDSRLALLKLFAGYLADDLKNGVSVNVSYTLGCLNDIYSDAMESLNAYLDGMEIPLASKYYSTGTITVRGDDMYATTEGADGEQLLYFVGFGHGEQAVADMESFKALGFNCLQLEVGPSSVLFPRDTGNRAGLNDDDQFSIDTSYITDYIIPALEKADDCDVAVSLLLSPHYMPHFLYDIYPDLKNDNSGFQKYNIYHPAAKRAIEVFLDTLIPMVKDVPSLMELCLTNEPHYKSCRSEYDIPAWQQYLQDKFPDISSLNSALNTTYSSFDEVIMPRTERASALMYEWVQFNNAYYSAWHQWMADIVKRNAPGVPVSSKAMSYTDNASQRVMYGVDAEQFDKFSDLNGSNAWNTLYVDNTTTKLLAYDLLTSISDKPVINSEDHVLYDSSEKYFEPQDAASLAQHCYADVWQGAAHGRNVSMYWIWERAADSKSGAYNSLLMRPNALISMSDAALDANRLASELDALNCASDDPDVYILFSNTSRVYSRMYTSFVDTAYRGALFSGKSVGIVTENTVSNIKDGKLLIVPNCTNVPAETLNTIKKYLENSNKVLMLGRCLTRDEHDKVFDTGVLSYIYENAEILGSNPLSKVVELVLRLVRLIVNSLSKAFNFEPGLDLDYAITKNIFGSLFSPEKLVVIDNDIKEKIIELTGESDVVLKGGNGEYISKCEIRAAEHGQKILINVCSYSWDAPVENVSVYYKGELVTGMTNRLTEKPVSDGFTLEPYTPVLLEFAR